jgi:hypothetical protein
MTVTPPTSAPQTLLTPTVWQQSKPALRRRTWPSIAARSKWRDLLKTSKTSRPRLRAHGRLRPRVHVVQPPDGPAVPLRRLLRHDPRRRGQRRRPLPLLRRHAAQSRRGWRVCHAGIEPQTSRSQTGLLLTRLGLALDRAPPDVDVSALTSGGGGGGGGGFGGGATVSAEEMASVVLSEILSPGLLESLGVLAEAPPPPSLQHTPTPISTLTGHQVRPARPRGRPTRRSSPSCLGCASSHTYSCSCAAVPPPPPPLPPPPPPPPLPPLPPLPTPLTAPRRRHRRCCSCRARARASARL